MMPGNLQISEKVLIPTSLEDLEDKGRNRHIGPLLIEEGFLHSSSEKKVT